MKLAKFLLLLTALSFSSISWAESEGGALPNYAYFAFEPDIITNYIQKGKKLGYVRVTVEIMVENQDALSEVDHHAPLIRDAIIEVLGRQSKDDIRSLQGRDEIRQQCLDIVNDLLVQETGKKLAANLLFTKYIYE